MSTSVGRYFPDGRNEIMGYVFPGETMQIFTGGDDGTYNKSVLVKCSIEMPCAEIFDLGPGHEFSTHEELEAGCTHETLVESLRLGGKPSKVRMYDAEDGPFELIVKQCFSVTYN